MDLLAGSAERIPAVSVTGAKASRRICVSGSLYRIVRGQDFRGRFNQASATRLSSIATTLWYNGFKHGCDVVTVSYGKTRTVYKTVAAIKCDRLARQNLGAVDRDLRI